MQGPVLVTGAAGQVGGDLVAALLASGAHVIATDLQVPAHARGHARLSWQALDVTDQAAVARTFDTHRPACVIHLAAILSARGEEHPARTFDVNLLGTRHVFDAARAVGVQQVIWTSTIAVFGGTLPETVGDHMAQTPTTMYGVTKSACERLADYYAYRYGFDVRAVRFPGLISAHEPGGGSSDYALYMYTDAVRNGRYEAFCRPDTRIPFMYMPDAIDALLKLAHAPAEALTRRTYNIAAMSPSAQDLANAVTAAVPGARITFAPDPVRQQILDSWPKVLDDTCARQDWGWAPTFDLARMTHDLLARLRG